MSLYKADLKKAKKKKRIYLKYRIAGRKKKKFFIEKRVKITSLKGGKTRK